MRFHVKITAIIAVFSSCMLLLLTGVLLYKGHQHLMMLNLPDSTGLIHHFDMALRETAIWSVAILILVIIISSSLIARLLIRPIQEMNLFAQRLVQGKRNLHISYQVNDQVGQLVQSLLVLDKTLHMYEKRRKEMTQDLAHEIRNPLASIKSYISAFQDGVWEATPERLQACMEEIDRMIHLVGELDTLNDINSPTFKIKLNKQKIAPIIEQSVLALASDLLEKDIEMEMDIDQALEAKVDALRLHQILHNIMKNAIHHVPCGGKISIQLSAQPNDFYRISIRDNGNGMDEETKKQIFERHFRGSSGYRGYGLGLSITKKLIQAHNGNITVESTPAIGTTISLTMPT